MPFYYRTRPPLPLWQPPAAGAAALLVYTLGQALFGMPSQANGGPGVGGRVLYVLGFTLLGGLLAGAAYWGLQRPEVRRPAPLYAAAVTLATFLGIVLVASAGAAYDARGGIGRLYRPGWFVSTLIVAAAAAVAFTFVYLPRRDAAARVYLSPADYAALSPGEKERLQPAPDPR